MYDRSGIRTRGTSLIARTSYVMPMRYLGRHFATPCQVFIELNFLINKLVVKIVLANHRLSVEVRHLCTTKRSERHQWSTKVCYKKKTVKEAAVVKWFLLFFVDWDSVYEFTERSLLSKGVWMVSLFQNLLSNHKNSKIVLNQWPTESSFRVFSIDKPKTFSVDALCNKTLKRQQKFPQNTQHPQNNKSKPETFQHPG